MNLAVFFGIVHLFAMLVTFFREAVLPILFLQSNLAFIESPWREKFADSKIR